MKMPLFQNSVVTKYLKTQNLEVLNKKWIDFSNHFHHATIQENIRNSKEEQYQGEFLIDLFVNVLGYTKNPTPNFNLTTELKNIKDSKKADGAIIIEDKVKAIIELKGTNTTDLSKIETQAFGYKNNQNDCTYVITSNFEKLRFYIDNAIEHLEFNLFTLTQDDFHLLYLCLALENIKNDVAKNIKEESLSAEDVITKKLYKDYSQFKRELHHNLVQLNTQYDPLELFKKSQKLLDRFLFLFFAEDCQLLPPNSVKLILNQWKQLQELDEYIPLFDRFKKYFGYLNTGYKGKQYDIYAYNGGLFKPDDILDHISIDDDLLYMHTLKLSEYDFASEVDVNILGHIFENSLNEIDEMKAQLEDPMGLNPLDKKNTKRKKEGVFYTPKYITKYIVENTVGKLCEEKKVELAIVEEDYFIDKKRTNKTKQPLLDKLTQYRNWLLQITIVDPACGSGAFLNQALNFLIDEHQYIDELQAKLFGDDLVMSDVEKSILENNLFGVDLNEESVEIAKLSLWLRTAQPNRKLNDLNHNIKCGNSLIDDPEIAGEKAFNWRKAFPQVFKLKNLEAYHLVFTTHNSRISQRMIDYKVVKGEALELNLEHEIALANIFKDIVLENNYRLLAFNICKDHVHLILVCEFDELHQKVQKLKGMSSRLFSSKGFKPLGEPLWSQKFFFADLDVLKPSEISYVPGHCFKASYLDNATKYIANNREKHNLPMSNELNKIIAQFVINQEQAFEDEYKGGFDVVIGNPPYGVNFNEIEKKYLSNFDSTVPDFEIYIYFISLYKNILSANGLLSYIFPNTFLSTIFGKKYREEIFNNTEVYQIIDLSNDNTFVDASVRTCIFTFKNAKNNYISHLYKVEKKEFIVVNSISKVNILNETDNVLSLFSQNKDERSLIEKLQKHKKLKDFLEVSQGLIPYDKYRGHDEFTIKNRIWHADFQKDETYKKELKGGDVNRYSIIWNENLWISYGIWLAAPRDIKFFISKRILVREITADKLFCGYTEEEFYNTPSCINIINEKNILELKYALTLLNSKLIGWLHNKVSPKANKGLFPKILINDVRIIPMVEISIEDQQPFIEKADLMLSLSKGLQSLGQKFERTIMREFGIDKLSKKLEKWFELQYGEFISELGKGLKPLGKLLSLSQKSEWEDYFTQEQQKAVALKQQIDDTDREIDQMVYELYGLTEE